MLCGTRERTGHMGRGVGWQCSSQAVPTSRAGMDPENTQTHMGWDLRGKAPLGLLQTSWEGPQGQESSRKHCQEEGGGRRDPGKPPWLGRPQGYDR